MKGFNKKVTMSSAARGNMPLILPLIVVITILRQVGLHYLSLRYLKGQVRVQKEFLNNGTSE